MTGTFFFANHIQEAGEDPHDNPAKPFSKSKTSNWVARAGGLPHYIQHVAHALVKNGHDESKAISMAVGIVRNWSEGKGGVHKAIKAAAAKAIAEWEAKKAKSHVSEELHVSEAWGELGRAEQVEEAYFVLRDVGSAIGGAALGEILAEAKLTTKERNALPSSAFAIPSKREYPIHDESHARDALARASGKPEEATVRAAVKKRYPKMGKSEEALDAAAEVGVFQLLVAESAGLIEAAPNWMLPVAATRPGFRPVKPEKPKSSIHSYAHKRAPKGTPSGGQFITTGSSGREVSAIQRRLGISETGTYGGKTKRRVEQFQKRHGLQVDGVIGRQTVAALRGHSNAASVAPGSLTKHDRRYLRRYTNRTGATNSRSVSERRVFPKAGTTRTPAAAKLGTASKVPGGSSGPKSSIIRSGYGSTTPRRTSRPRTGRGGVIV